jgi:hypothetical protein
LEFALQQRKKHGKTSVRVAGYVNGNMSDKAITPLKIYINSKIGTVSKTCHDKGWDGK